MAKMWLEDLLNPELCEHYYIAKWTEDSGKHSEKIFDTEDDALDFLVGLVRDDLAGGRAVEVCDVEF